jgi:predicted DsbA family dithiol-disulfide isomerase
MVRPERRCCVMITTVEVFADITCPFSHVGLKRVVEHLAQIDHFIEVIVRAWPLEWVNGTALGAAAVVMKAGVLHDQIGVNDFAGFRENRWPRTTIPALELAATAYAIDAASGLAVSMALHEAVFEEGRDVSDPDVLAEIAAAHGVTAREVGAVGDAVRADYDDGLARGVSGSPHFWMGSDEFFCPTLDIGHDANHHLTARFDPEGLAQFFARIDS